MSTEQLSELSKPVAWASQRHIDTRHKIEAFTDEASANGTRWVKVAPLYSQEYVSALTQRIAELEASETQLIQERDSAEQALADMYEAATGERPEWSNWFGFADAIEEVAQVRARLATPVRLPARKAVRHPAGYPEDAAREAGYNEALSDVGEALDVQGFTVEGALVTAVGHQGGARS
ncbi:hypothetical protein [Serratia ureilytica]|uniref:hypothetical protein n=1 Tax=Serratia ureilytica TaxID=300181 RepID=UPI003703F25F